MAANNKRRTVLSPRSSGTSLSMSDSLLSDPYDFEPVPSTSRRHDGRTAERQRFFIAVLREIGMVSAAAAAAGMSRKSA